MRLRGGAEPAAAAAVRSAGVAAGTSASSSGASGWRSRINSSDRQCALPAALSNTPVAWSASLSVPLP